MSSQTANMYRVHDHVYFEQSSGAPYQIRRIEELNRTNTGNVEAKVVCFARRRDISNELLQIADQDQELAKEEEKHEADKTDTKPVGAAATNKRFQCGGLPLSAEALPPQGRHQLRHRELYLNRGMVETLPATHIRGKCDVHLLNELETAGNYMGKDDVFYYSLVYDQSQRSLIADKGEIRVGDKYQTRCPPLLTDEEKVEYEAKELPEMLIFHPHHKLTDREMDQFLVVARSVGTFSRALDMSSSTKLPSLHQTVAAASRDVTPAHAYALLHQADYDLGRAMKYLVPPPNKSHYPLESDKNMRMQTVSLGGPVLCRDQLEEWSAAEANLFEEALDKLGKDFTEIRRDYLPWKSVKDVVEYYYMWKTTDRCVQQKRVKALESESKLKQVYIPNYNKPNPNLIAGQPAITADMPQIAGQRPCESCDATHSGQWYAWGPSTLGYRVCMDCWSYWKKFGALKRQHEHENHDKAGTASRPLGNTNGAPQQATIQSRPNRIGGFQSQPTPVVNRSVPRSGQNGGPMNLSVKANSAARQMFLLTPWTLRVLRRLAPKQLINGRRLGRRPIKPLDYQGIKIMQSQIDPARMVARASKLSNFNKCPAHLLSQLTQHATTMKQTALNPPRPAKRTADEAVNGAPISKSVRRGEPTLNNDYAFMKWATDVDECVFVSDKQTKSMRGYLTSPEMRHLSRTPTSACKYMDMMLPKVEASSVPRPIREDQPGYVADTTAVVSDAQTAVEGEKVESAVIKEETPSALTVESEEPKPELAATEPMQQ